MKQSIRAAARAMIHPITGADRRLAPRRTGPFPRRTSDRDHKLKRYSFPGPEGVPRRRHLDGGYMVGRRKRIRRREDRPIP